MWEKWKTINMERYCERIVPLVHGWLTVNPHLQFMQDGTQSHAAEYTINELPERGITSTYWLPFSPDLNPIEVIWNRMKDYIEAYYPDLPAARQPTYDQLRGIVQEDWDSVTPEDLREIIGTTKDCCQAVIDAKGGHTKY